MGQTMLSTIEYASVRGCSPQYIKRCAANGRIRTIETVNTRGRKKYLIPFSALTAEEQAKYLQLNRIKAEEAADAKEPKQADLYSEQEREEIRWWQDAIEQWLEYRGKRSVDSKAKVDETYVQILKSEYPDRSISLDILYRKWRAYREKDLDALIDKRGKWRKGQSSVDEVVWQAFLYYYLDESQPTIQKCLDYTKLWCREVKPELYDTIPSYSAFYRKVQRDLPLSVKILGRLGEKAFDDRCAAYIRRNYEEMKSNEWWIADNHTFDIITVDKNGKQHRPYLTAFLDARSGIFTGYYVTYAPSSEATLYALRRGILRYGIPENIYVDNGREFLTFDIGGLGHRRKKQKDGWQFVEPPGVFKRLGIKMTNAIVRNAKAKIIERRFRDVKEDFSKLFSSYTGGNVLEKPERLKKVLKTDGLYTDEEFEKLVETVIEGYLNQQPYNGDVEADWGKTRMEVYNEKLKETRQRRAKAEDLSLMMLRSTRPQKVGRLGVSVPVAGSKLQYWTDEFKDLCFGKQVYVRYDPDDLSKVRVYDLEDRFVMEVPAESKAVSAYGADKEQVQEALKVTRSFKRAQKERLKGMILEECDQRTALDLVLGEAQRNIEAGKNQVAKAKVIEIQRADEQPAYQQVVGGSDMDVMIRNAEKRKEEK